MKVTQDDINHGGPIATLCRRQCLAGDQAPELTHAIWRLFDRRERAIEEMINEQRRENWRRLKNGYEAGSDSEC